MKWYRLRIWFW